MVGRNTLDVAIEVRILEGEFNFKGVYIMNIKDYQVVLLGVLIALGSIFSTYVLSNAVVEFQKLQNQSIRVTGSASRNVTSDNASWQINYTTLQPTLKEGYAKINEDTKKIKDFFLSKGIDEKSMNFEQISSYKVYKKAANGYSSTDELKGYEVSRSVVVKSNDINKLTEISKNVDELVNQDIDLTTQDVQYFVSNLDDIKVDVIASASKNAKERAKSLVKGTNGHIGVMTSARVGVFQIVPVDSTEVSDYGINDTSSIEKKVISTVTATFTVK